MATDLRDAQLLSEALITASPELRDAQALVEVLVLVRPTQQQTTIISGA